MKNIFILRVDMTRLEFMPEQKQDLMDYLKRTEKAWARVVQTNPDISDTATYFNSNNTIYDRYVPQYDRISKQIDKIIELEQKNKPGSLPWSQIHISDLLQLIVNSFWGILSDLFTNPSWDIFIIDNRLLAIVFVLSLFWFLQLIIFPHET